MFTTATKRRILIIIFIVIIIWQICRLVGIPLSWQSDDIMVRPFGAPVLVMVFYESLCPDSKNFILKQLVPTYRKAPDLIEIQFVPYGKAKTEINADGSLKFDCQHGQLECQGNIYHACAIEAIEDPKTKLDVVACMIRDNRLPKEAMQKCTREHHVETAELIQKCYDSPHGSELLKLHGEATHALKPPVSFIPTVTLDGSQGRQASILKDLFGEVCKVAAGRGPLPEICL
ncbi:GILT-like protein 1 [Condylostylus longicornis]|uniref:GILT-like protein 1 n=1 Tax=Condylostylus longicornis TaxID=2530218 RepID=UPI00244DFC2A|nr:GILT-like protein 1 [Condylostylus longicornis]